MFFGNFLCSGELEYTREVVCVQNARHTRLIRNIRPIDCLIFLYRFQSIFTVVSVLLTEPMVVDNVNVVL